MAMRATLGNLVLPRRYAIDVRKLLLGGDVAISESSFPDTQDPSALVRVEATVIDEPPPPPFLSPETRTIGLVVLVLHRAHLTAFPSYAGPSTAARTRSATAALSVSRAKRTVDPFVEASWAGMAKALYRTKVVRGVSLGNPVGVRAKGAMDEKREEGGEARWEEMCFLRVPLEPVEDGAKCARSSMCHSRLRAWL